MKDTTEKARAFETSLDIDASRDDVWRALTEAEELMRWFPLEARVTPGPGGSMHWSWGEGWSWETRIDAWEPGRLLRLVQDDYRPSDEVATSRVAMEFTLETHAGKTRLRLVHSGFGRGAAWDHELDSISEGWPSELRSLRLYLQRHRGRARHVGRALLSLAVPPQAAWAKLVGPEGLRLSPAEPQPGAAFEVVAPTGERLRGTVEACLPRQSLTGTVRELDDALLRLTAWRGPDGKTNVWVWLAAYTGDPQRVRAFQQKAQDLLGRLFAGA
jgi:uncharacterized protein YndB with AHSA1/START domain